MSAAHRYTDVRNTTASKERLMVMLFEAAVRHMRTAARHLENKDRRAAAPLIDKACQIVLELQSTLKPEVAPQLTGNLIEIYTFTAAKLCRANITGDVKDVRQAERAFAPIADGFAQAVAQMVNAGQPAPTPPPGPVASTSTPVVRSGASLIGRISATAPLTPPARGAAPVLASAPVPPRIAVPVSAPTPAQGLATARARAYATVRGPAPAAAPKRP